MCSLNKQNFHHLDAYIDRINFLGNINCILTAVIILAVLLGISVIFELFELAWILNNQCRTTKVQTQ